MSKIKAGTTTTTAYQVEADTTGALVLQTGSTPTTAVTIDTSQNVGIGTGSPSNLLHIVKTKSGTGAESYDLIRLNSSGTSAIGDASNITWTSSGGTKVAGIGGILGGDNIAYGSIAFSVRRYTTDTYDEVMRIDNRGNVGIGTSSSPSKLGIQGASGQNAYIECGGNGNTLAGASALFGQNDSSIAYCWNRANAALLFGTNGTERMRIDSSGNLLVGVTSQMADAVLNVRSSGVATAAFDRQTSDGSILLCRRNNTTVGSINVTTSATTYATSSDYRLKENVQPMVDALSKINALKPVTYSWKLDGSNSQGFIAHELAEVCPDAVIGEKDAVDENGNPKYQGIDTSFLVATLTAAIQELKTELDAAKADIAILKGAA